MSDALRGKSVFITGHTGFIGYWLAATVTYLGGSVVGFALSDDPHTFHRKRQLIALGVEDHQGDIRSLERLDQVMSSQTFDLVVHLAAQPLVGLSYTDPRTTLDTNVRGSINLLECARKNPPAALLHVTSDKCYRPVRSGKAYNESSPLGGTSPYALSKAMAELAFEAYSSVSFDARPMVSVRLGNVLGGGDRADRLVPNALAAMEQGQIFSVRTNHATRPWQHVLDVVDGLLILADQLHRGSIETGQSLNLGPANTGVTSLDVLRLLGREMRRPELVSEDEDRSGYPEDTMLTLDSRRIADLLGWTHRLSIEETVRLVVEWHQAVATGQPATDVTLKQIRYFQSSRVSLD